MKIYSDIDGVLSRGNPRTLARLLNAMLGLNVADSDLERVETFSAFMEHPKVQAYIAEVGEAVFAQREAVISLAPKYLLTCQIIPDAVAGMGMLAREGSVSYCTCRKTEKPSFNVLVAQSTRTWLEQVAFPPSDQVIFCRTMKEKLEAIADQLAAYGETAIYIDDQYHKVLASLATLSEDRRSLLRRSLIVWAFGMPQEELLENADQLINLVALPSWARITEAIAVSRMLPPFCPVVRSRPS
jgi:hypothetical protein